MDNLRVSFIDSWRGCLIFLVVIGHTLGACFHFASQDTQRWLSLGYKIIYSFHMPAFFFLAGILWSAKRVPFRRLFIRKVKRLVVPYLFWGFASAMIFVAGKSAIAWIFRGATTDAYVGKEVVQWWRPFLSVLHAGGWPNGNGFQCNSVLWFLPAMFSLEVFVAIGCRICPGHLAFSLLFAVSLLLKFTAKAEFQMLPWGIGNIPNYLPYFLAGYFVKCRLGVNGILQKKGGGHRLPLCLLVVLHVCICYASPDISQARTSVPWFLGFLIVSIIGIACSMASAIEFDCTYLQTLGRKSMTIMFVHKFLILGMTNVLPVAKHIRCASVATTMAIVAAVSVIATGISFILGLYLERFFPKVIGEWR